MFKKVLVTEDLGSINHGVANALYERTDIVEVQQAQYCDEGYLKFRRAIKDNEPFDLLITDLSFKESHRKRNISNGIELIQEVRALNPELCVIIYSMEDRPGKVQSFFDDYKINGYVC